MKRIKLVLWRELEIKIGDNVYVFDLLDIFRTILIITLIILAYHLGRYDSILMYEEIKSKCSFLTFNESINLLMIK